MEAMKKERVLEKIKKLLALAGNNPSEEEATSASLKAQKLMNDYNLSLAEVYGEEKQPLGEAVYDCGVDHLWKYSLAETVAKNFRCEHYWVAKRKIVFYGYETDTAIAKEVFVMLFNTCVKNANRAADKAYYKTGSGKGVRYSYSKGFISGVREVLDKQCTSLMIITPTEVTEGYAELSKNFSNIEIKRRDGNRFHKDFYEDGKRDGKAIMNARAIEEV